MKTNDLIISRTGRGDFPEIVMKNRGGAQAVLSLYGGHLLEWSHPIHGEILYLSEKAVFTPGKAIRGGIPVIFPWFGSNPSKAQSHGFARNAMWELISSQADGDETRVTVGLKSNEHITPLWDNQFELQLTYILKDSLNVEISITNHSPQSCEYQFALHTYFAVESIADVVVEGLEGISFIDTTLPERPVKIQSEKDLRFHGQVDSIYANTPSRVKIESGMNYSIEVDSDLKDRVVWNPGEKIAAGLSDVEIGGYQKFVCVEAGQVANKITLAQGETFRGAQELRIIS